MKLYFYIAKLSFGWFLTYPLEFAADIFKRILQVVFIVMFWQLVIQENPGIMNIREIISYFIIVSAISDFVMVERLDYGKFVSKVIKSGEISNFLIKPTRIVLHLYFHTLGDRLSNLVYALFSFLLAFLINPKVTYIGLIIAIIYLVGGILVGFAINLFGGLLSFYITETLNLMFLIQYFLRVLSGAFIPLAFYPEALQKVLNLTPIPFLVFKPIEALTKTTIDISVLKDIVIVFSWALILNLMVLSLWKYSLRRYEATGL